MPVQRIDELFRAKGDYDSQDHYADLREKLSKAVRWLWLVNIQQSLPNLAELWCRSARRSKAAPAKDRIAETLTTYEKVVDGLQIAHRTARTLHRTS